MNRVAVACVGLLALAGGSAAAADLPPYYQPGPAYNPIYTWTGFYVGINRGGGQGTRQAAGVAPSGTAWIRSTYQAASSAAPSVTTGSSAKRCLAPKATSTGRASKGRPPCCALGAARPATSGSPPYAGGWALPSTASCPT